jgi:4-aminobutyrate aminotransferase / (S)-3-amino-2-methylpropionate transaminase / 5-aminovalerate transaminase
MIISNNNKKYLNLEKKHLKYETKNMTPNIRIKWKKAYDYKIVDSENKKYIDFTSGVFTSSIGYNNNHLKKIIKEAMDKGFNHSYHYYNEYREKYVSKLIKFINSPKLKKCFLTSAGTEATETAIKLARIYGSSINKNKLGIITIKGNWHGRTMGSQMLAGKNEASKWIGFFDKNIYQIDFPYPWHKNSYNKSFFHNSLKKTFKKNFNFKNKVSMIMLETFQGWGAIFYPKDYVKQIQKFCLKNNILLCFDEMQSGFARTGKKFGFEHYNVNPDMICCGKGMGSGFSLSGLISSNKVLSNKNISGLSSTHSSNPISCAAGIATIDIINKKKLVNNSRIQGVKLHKSLKKIVSQYDQILLTSLGYGLIASLIFKSYKKYSGKYFADKVSLKCLNRGLLVCNTGRESIKLGPPLIINNSAINQATRILSESIQEVFNEIS